jgi:hypothetical protein
LVVYPGIDQSSYRGEATRGEATECDRLGDFGILRLGGVPEGVFGRFNSFRINVGVGLMLGMRLLVGDADRLALGVSKKLSFVFRFERLTLSGFFLKTGTQSAFIFRVKARRQYLYLFPLV